MRNQYFLCMTHSYMRMCNEVAHQMRLCHLCTPMEELCPEEEGPVLLLLLPFHAGDSLLLRGWLLGRSSPLLLLWHNREEKGTSQLFAAPLVILLQARYSCDRAMAFFCGACVRENGSFWLGCYIQNITPCKKAWP